MHCGTQSNRAPRPRRACRACRQANRARSALAPAAQKKILRHAAFEHCIHNQGVSAFQLRVRAEQNLAPRTPFIINVTHTEQRGRPLARQYAGSNPPQKPAFARDFFAPLSDAGRDPRTGISCPFPRAQIFSSAITIPVRVFSFAAKSAATGKPRAQTSTPSLVNTGQPSRSQWLTCFSFSKRFSLWAF